MTHVKDKPLATLAGLVVIAFVALTLVGFFNNSMGALENELAQPEVPTAAADGSVAAAEAGAVEFSGAFQGVGPYTITGLAEVTTQDGQRILRLTDDFSTNNGPQLVIYLRAENGDFVNLGNLQSLEGTQDYEIPADIDLDVFSEVQVWCEPFGINFGSANLAAV